MRYTVSDIIKEIGDGVMYTMHSHTQYCDGRNTMEQFVSKAASMGFTHYGFTPHSPVPIESPCNMSMDDVPKFLAEVDRLQQAYPSVRLYKGMEVDYLSDNWNAANDYFRSLPLDYTISSVHFIPNQEGEYYDIDGKPASFLQKLDANFGGDLRYVVDTFFEQSQQMISKGGFEIIGHFDKIKHNGSFAMPDLEKTPWYNTMVNDLIDSIIASGVIVEINTKAWVEFQQMFPAQRHWRRLIEAGVPILVNSDAHYVDRINASRPEALKALCYIREHANQ